MSRPRRRVDPKLLKRLQSLIGTIWFSQHEMAEELGVTQAYISKVFNGQLPPSERLIALLAANAKINADWLQEGKGEAQSLFAAGALPIAHVLLPGPPDKFSELFTHSGREVVQSMCKIGYYFYEVPPDIAKMLGPEVLAGDVILFDSNLTGWFKSPRRLDRRLCVILNSQTDRRPELGWVKVTNASTKVAFVEWIHEKKIASFPEKRRRLDLGEYRPQEPDTSSANPFTQKVKLTDVVAVALRLERDL